MFSRIKNIIREYKEIKYLAYHDSLTGLYNRNWLYKNINQIRKKYVYFIDINDLRKVNERGHSYGDEYIKNICNSIKHDGFLVRYAGDEFLLFTDSQNVIRTNKLYSVGCSEINDCILSAINSADTRMLKSKRFFKKL